MIEIRAFNWLLELKRVEIERVEERTANKIANEIDPKVTPLFIQLHLTPLSY